MIIATNFFTLKIVRQMKNTSQKLWLFIAAFTLILLGSSFIFSPTEATTFIVVDDVHGMINGTDNDEGSRVAAPKKLPEKIRIPTPTVTFKGQTVRASDSIWVMIRQVTPTGAPGAIVVQGRKSIPHNPTAGYQFPLTITPLTRNVWYTIELTFKHKNGQLITQKGQIVRTNP